MNSIVHLVAQVFMCLGGLAVAIWYLESLKGAKRFTSHKKFALVGAVVALIGATIWVPSEYAPLSADALADVARDLGHCEQDWLMKHHEARPKAFLEDPPYKIKVNRLLIREAGEQCKIKTVLGGESAGSSLVSSAPAWGVE